MVASHEPKVLFDGVDAGPPRENPTDRSVEAWGEHRPGAPQAIRPAGRAYRAVLLAADGRIATFYRFDAQDDAEAIVRATELVDGHAVEVWDGGRFIAHFPSGDEGIALD